MGQVGERLHVVDHGRLAVEALHRREGWLEPGLAAEALQRVDERRLLAADVGPGAAVDDDVAAEVGAEDAAADVAGGAGLLDAALQEQALVVVLATDVDEGDRCLDRVGRDQRSFDELVRVLVDERPVLEAARLRLVGVDAEVAGMDALGEERPLQPGGEAGPAAPADAARLDLGDQVVGGHAAERLAQALVAADALVDGEGLDAVHPEVLGQQLVLGHQRPPRPRIRRPSARRSHRSGAAGPRGPLPPERRGRRPGSHRPVPG